jgi:hypothetical protein
VLPQWGRDAARLSSGLRDSVGRLSGAPQRYLKDGAGTFGFEPLGLRDLRGIAVDDGVSSFWTRRSHSAIARIG